MELGVHNPVRVKSTQDEGIIIIGGIIDFHLILDTMKSIEVLRIF